MGRYPKKRIKRDGHHENHRKQTALTKVGASRGYKMESETAP